MLERRSNFHNPDLPQASLGGGISRETQPPHRILVRGRQLEVDSQRASPLTDAERKLLEILARAAPQKVRSGPIIAEAFRFLPSTGLPALFQGLREKVEPLAPGVLERTGKAAGTKYSLKDAEVVFEEEQRRSKFHEPVKPKRLSAIDFYIEYPDASADECIKAWGKTESGRRPSTDFHWNNIVTRHGALWPALARLRTRAQMAKFGRASLTPQEEETISKLKKYMKEKGLKDFWTFYMKYYDKVVPMERRRQREEASRTSHQFYPSNLEPPDIHDENPYGDLSDASNLDE